MLRKLNLFFIFLMGFSGLAFAQSKDTIYFKNNQPPKEAAILKENYKGVDVQIGNAKTSYLWKDIDRIEYQLTPTEIQDGFAQFSSGNYEAAMQTYNQLKNRSGLREVFKQQAMFYFAQAAEMAGKYDEAVKAYQDLLNQFPDSRYLNQANEHMATVLMGTKRYAEAQKAIDAARQKAVTEKLDSEVMLNLDFILAELLWSQKKYAEAAKAYEKIATSAPADSVYGTLATIRAAQCKVDESNANHASAKAVFEGVIKNASETTPNIVLAAAWNGMGQVQLEEGKTAKELGKVQEALYAFLRGLVMYFPIEGERSSEHERSLYYASKTFEFLAGMVKEEELKTRNIEWAKEKRRELQGRYPLSTYIDR